MHRVLHCFALIALTGTCLSGGTGTADLLVMASPGFPSVMMMGPAGRAIGGGPGAVFANPAMVVPGFSASGGRWNLSTTAVSIGGAVSPGGGTSLGAGLLYLGRGGIVRRNEAGEVTGEYSFSTGYVAAGGSMPLGPWLRAGCSAGLSWESVDGESVTGLGASLGLAGEPWPGFRTGISVTGLGSSPSWNGIHKDMPTIVSAGAEATVGSGITAFAGGELGLSTADHLGAGMSMELSGFRVSAGYGISPGEDELSGLFGGFSYTYESGESYTMEAAFTQRDNLDWPILAGISVEF